MSWGGNHIQGARLRNDRGQLVAMDAMQRFIDKCEFCPRTGCVIWVGAKCWGRGKSIRYGSFRDGPRTHLAHRWSAKNIHGLEIDGLQVDHCCPLYRAGNEPLLPNTLCVQHVQAITGDYNRHLQTERRRHFVHLEVGLLPYTDVYGEICMVPDDAIPFYEPPAWLLRKAA